MRARDGGGGAGTIVVDIPGVRRTAARVADGAHAYAILASRLRGRALPEMPPDVAGRVALELSEVCCLIGSEPQLLLDAAQEMRVRAFWAEAADRLMSGYDLEGSLLNEFKAAYASGLLLRYSEPWQAGLAREYAEKLHDREHPGGFAGFVKDVGDFFEGAWDAIKDPAVMLYHLTPLHSGWQQSWSDLGHGLEYGVTHPVEFGKAMINLDALEERGFSYWLGNLAPAAAATLLSGGAAAGVRGAEGATAVERAAVAGSRLERSLAAAGRTWSHDLLRPGPLTPANATLDELRRSAAQTFAGGKYDLVTTKEPFVVYKAGEHPGGRFFSLDPPLSEAQVRIDSAVKPVWTDPEGRFLGSSPLENGYAFVVENPRHALPMGPVGPQGGVYLGGPDKIQVYIHDRSASGLRLVGEWKLGDKPPEWVPHR
jgi:hypothetical protein